MADDVIGRADYELRARIDQLKGDLATAEGELAKSGDRGEAIYAQKSAKWTPVIAEGVKTGLKLVGAATASMLAIATKGALELKDVQNDYQSETGASAEEAKRVGKVINQVAGENQKSLQSVSAAAIAIHNDLGAVGDQADNLLARFTKFGRVTKQEPVAAVKAFDDILDAWNLTAADTQKVMDALVLSHQKYGGSVSEDQAALAALAPTLRAMNGTWQDAIAMLDLAKASGLDTGDAIAGLNKALGKVKSPEELQRLIDDISNTTDPFLRAQKAADLFGQKAGPKLANALAGKHLQDFAINMDEAAGATDKAAEALDQGFGAQARKKLSEFGAALRGLGDDWGPVLTGAAGFASLAGALGVDTIVTKLGPKVVAAMKTVGTQGGEALVDAAGTATGALGTIIGNNISNRIEAVFGAGETVLGRVWRRLAASRVVIAAAAAAGTVSGAAYGAASAAGAKLAEFLAPVWTRITPILRPIVLAAGIQSGITFGAGAAEGAAGASTINSFASAGSAAGRAFGLAAAAAALLIPVLAAPGMQAGANDALGLPSDADQAARNQKIAELFHKAGAKAGAAFTAAGEEQLRTGRDRWAQEAATIGQDTVTAFGDSVAKAVGPLGTRIPADVARAMDWRRLNGLTRAAGFRNMEAFAQGIAAARQKPVDAFNTLVEMLKHPLTRGKEQARLLGELTSKALAKGLKSYDPEIRAQAEATRQYLIDRLNGLRTGSGKLSKEAAALVAKGLRSKDPEIRAAARHIKQLATKPLHDAKTQAHADGQNVAEQFAAGLSSAYAIRVIQQAAIRAAHAADDFLHGASPPPKGPLHTIDEGGRNVGIAWAGGVASSAEYARRAAAHVAGVAASSFHTMLSPNGLSYAVSAGYGMGPVPLAVDSGGRRSATIHHHDGNVSIGAIHLHGVGSDVSPGAAKRFGTQVLDEVVRGFRDQSRRTSGVPRGRP